MSWSLQASGTPGAVVARIEKHSTMLNGESKVAFDEAKPFLIGLVKQNFNTNRENLLIVKLDAHGHGCGKSASANAPNEGYRNCSVSLESFYAECDWQQEKTEVQAQEACTC